jgi:hypothetical protein
MYTPRIQCLQNCWCEKCSKGMVSEQCFENQVSASTLLVDRALNSRVLVPDSCTTLSPLLYNLLPQCALELYNNWGKVVFLALSRVLIASITPQN